MSSLTKVWILAAVAVAPCAVNAADDRAALLRKADVYAFEARQYRAAGKPVTNTIANRYAQLSQIYRAQASEAHSNR
jgi:hypothetical protein